MDVQTVTVVIAGIGLVIAAINSVISSRRAEHQRQTQLLMELYNRWSVKEFQKQYGRVRYYYDNKFETYDEFNQLIGADPEIMGWSGELDEKNVDIYADFNSLAEFFEGIGVLVKRGLIDVDLVEDLLANRVIWWWEMYKPISDGARTVADDPKLHEHTEYLYREMRKRQQQATTAS